MKLKTRLISLLLCLVLVLGIFPAATAPKADAAIGTILGGFVINQLLNRGMMAMAEGVAAIGEATDDTETAALVNKWAFGIHDESLEAIAKLGEQMEKFHEEVMDELQFIEEKLDSNISGIETALGTNAAEDAYDNYVDAWADDVTVPMALNGYNQVVNSYKIYLEYAGSYKTGSTVSHGGQQVVATEDMVRDCYDAFCAALITMTGQAYDANSGMSYEEYYDHILYETNVIDLKVQTTINNLLGRMLNATGAPVGGRYLDRAAQVAFAYFPFSEDQADFVDAAAKKQAYEITMALMAYQEFIGMRLSYCDAKYEALKESGASEDELAALQEKIDNYCAPNGNIIQLISGGAACNYPGGVLASVNSWLSAPVYISNADNSYLYLDNYLRTYGTGNTTLTNTNFISETDPQMLMQESLDELISPVIWMFFWDEATILDKKCLASEAENIREHVQFIRRGVVVPTKNGQAVVKPIYILADETADKSGMYLSELKHLTESGLESYFIVPHADFYNLRDGVYSDGNNTYTMTTGSRLKVLTDRNPLSLNGGKLQNYFQSAIGTYPEGRALYVLAAATKGEETSPYGYTHTGINMTSVATFAEDDIPYADHSSTSYIVVLDSTSNDTYVNLDTKAASGIDISVSGDHYDASTGKTKAGTSVTVTVDPNGNDIPPIFVAYHEDASDPTRITYTEELLDADMAAKLVSEDGTFTLQYTVPFSNVTLMVGNTSGLCDHPEDQRLLNITNHYGTHNIYEVCNACGLEIRNVTEPCVDEDEDGICDICNGAARCPHDPLWWQTTANSNNDGTHTLVRLCTTCGQVADDTEKYPCYDGDSDGKCDSCGYQLGDCQHISTSTSYSDNGDKTHTVTETCDTCTEVRSQATAACTDEDEDNKCDDCGAVIREVPKIIMAGSNMNLGNALEVNFLFMIDDVVGDGYTAVVTHYYADGRTVETEYVMEDWMTLADLYYYIPISVTAKEMSDTLSIEIFDKDGNAASEPYSTSVREYAGKALTFSTTSEYIKIMVVDMLNYGAAAQVYFEYNVDDLANNQLTEAQQAIATPTPSVEDISTKGNNCYGSNLTLDDRIQLNMFFENMPGNTEGMCAVIEFTDHYGKARSITVDNSEFVEVGTTYTRITVDDIVLADARCTVTMTVYNADGSVFGTCIDSVESYVARAKAEVGAELFDTIIKFADSAYTYLHNRTSIF